MVVLYNCRHAGDQYRITKFSDDMNVESSYLCTESTCNCPAGVRPMCRHREMLPKFIQRNHIGDEWFYDHDRGGWVQQGLEWAQQGISTGEEREPTPANYIYSEEDCPGHVASELDTKICGRCGIHVSSLITFEPMPPLPKGVVMVDLNDPLEVHNAIAEAVGEPEAMIPAPPKPKALFIRRRI